VNPLDLRHGLTFDKIKGYRLRVTISRGRKIIGRRIPIWLHTRDLEVAMLKRDAIVEGYRKIGLIVVQRPQRRREKQEGGAE
jgi:hypothetical protein